jgi:hypothetical protein
MQLPCMRALNLRQEMLVKYAPHGAERKLEREIVGIKDFVDAVRTIDALIARLDDGGWNITAG